VSHRNSRLTFHRRLLIVSAEYRQGWKQAHIADAMGVFCKCVATWIKRYATEGEDGHHYLHSVVDDKPRRAYSEVLPDEKGSTYAAFLARAVT
jgi:transposase